MRPLSLPTALLLSCLVLPAACSKEGGDAPAASGKPVATAAPKPSANPAPALRNADGKLTKAGFHAAWKEIYHGGAAAYEPAEKKAAAFVAKVGKPAKVDGDKQIWWVFDGAACYRSELGKDGTKGDEKVPAEKCEK